MHFCSAYLVQNSEGRFRGPEVFPEVLPEVLPGVLPEVGSHLNAFLFSVLSTE